MYKVVAKYGKSKSDCKTEVAFHREEISAIVATAETESFLKDKKYPFVAVTREKIELSCSNLVIELGRMCNMNCEHCLRGHSENAEISLDDAAYAIKMFDSINSITFTGGEPVLYQEKIIQIVELILALDVPISSFYIASNGTPPSQELLFALCKLYAHCDDKEFCRYEASKDRWHDFPEFPDWMSAFSFVGERGDISEASLINEGNAYENGIGNRHLNHSKEFYYDEDYGEVDLLYVNSFGELLADCDYSYETQREIDSFSLDDIRSGAVTPQEVFVKTFKESSEEE